VPTFTKIAGVVWQVTVGPAAGFETVQLAAFTQPVSVRVWQNVTGLPLAAAHALVLLQADGMPGLHKGLVPFAGSSPAPLEQSTVIFVQLLPALLHF
jgi:hypothetical protein